MIFERVFLMLDFIIKYWLEVLFGGFLTLLGFLYKRMSKRIKENSERDQAIADGMKYLLMFKLRDEGERKIAEGHCSAQDKHEYEKVYNAYHALGGNDTITELKNQVLRLPS